MVVVADEEEAARFAELGMRPVVDAGEPAGVELAAAVLDALDVEADAIADWSRRRRGVEGPDPVAAAA